MELQQKLTDLCLICSEFMGDFKNGLGNVTQWSHKPLFQMFETFISINITQHELEERQICQNCLIKINELDEYQVMVEKIATDLITLYNSSVATEVKPDIKIEALEDPDNEEIIETLKRPSRKSRKIEDHSVERKKREKITHLNQNDPAGFTVTEIDGKLHYKCLICSKVVVRRPQLHLLTHSTEKKFECEQCGQFFKSLKCLYGHKKTHGERIYWTCDLCGFKYLQKNQLRKHIDAIHLKTDYICEICGKSYNRNSTLQIHMLTHDGEKNVICTVCGFRTHTKSKMTRHMKSHTGERNYSCEICGKRFLYSYNVIAHVNYVHKGLRPKVNESKLICNICGKKFQKQKKVKEHMAEVHNISEVTDGSAIVEEGGEEVVEWIVNY